MSTSDSANSVSTDKDYKSNKCTANAVFNFQLKATSYLWTVVYSDLHFNIIIMYCLSHNLLCSFTINSLHKKNPTISTPPHQHLYIMPCICRHSITDIIHLLYKQLGRSRSPKMRCIHLVMYYGSALLLFRRKVQCLQTLWQVIAHWVIGPYLGTKVQTCTSCSF